MPSHVIIILRIAPPHMYDLALFNVEDCPALIWPLDQHVQFSLHFVSVLLRLYFLLTFGIISKLNINSF
jgi:hypothetical protein